MSLSPPPSAAEELEPLLIRAPDGRPLAKRQAETLRALLRGSSEKEAAIQLGLSIHTIHVYVKLLYRRYRVNSRSELLANIYSTAMMARADEPASVAQS